MSDPDHLHVDDVPDTLALLSAFVGHQSNRAYAGYQPTEHGAYVDWDRLLASGLSSTEKAAVHIARGCQILERDGGAPPQLAAAIAVAVNAVAGTPAP